MKMKHSRDSLSIMWSPIANTDENQFNLWARMVIIWPFQIKLVIGFKRTQTGNDTSFGHLKHPLDTGQGQIFCQRSPKRFVKDWESEVEMIWNQLNCIGESVGYWPLEVNISWGLPVRRKQQHRIHKTEYEHIRRDQKNTGSWYHWCYQC